MSNLYNVKPVWGSNRPSLKDCDWESGPDRKLAHNTYRVTGFSLRDLSTGASVWYDGPAVMYHRTIIIGLKSEGAYLLNTGGYRTSTTKQRINALLPPSIGPVYQRDFEWYVSARKGVQDIPFTDGMVVTTY